LVCALLLGFLDALALEKFTLLSCPYLSIVSTPSAIRYTQGFPKRRRRLDFQVSHPIWGLTHHVSFLQGLCPSSLPLFGAFPTSLPPRSLAPAPRAVPSLGFRHTWLDHPGLSNAGTSTQGAGLCTPLDTPQNIPSSTFLELGITTPGVLQPRPFPNRLASWSLTYNAVSSRGFAHWLPFLSLADPGFQNP
jgi:hypothetical protein